ncbi:MAG: hypothetical protein WBE92_01830 [Steroidobacteraceae bacterium]
MKLHSLASLVVCASLLAGFSISAQAQAPSPDFRAAVQAVRTACDTDTKTYCADKQGREVFACLRSNNDKLSQGCKDAMAKLPQRRPAAPPPQQ